MVDHAYAQHLQYDILKGGKNIGTFEVNKMHLANGKERITIVSKVEYKLLFKFLIDFNLEENYEYGVLQDGKSKNMLNGVVQKESKIRKQGEDYILEYGGVPNRISEQINYSIAEIYFREPNAGLSVFSQHFGKFLVFEETERDVYKIESPDGDNYYTYDRGICSEIKIFRDFANLTFRLQPNSFARVKQKSDTTGN